MPQKLFEYAVLYHPKKKKDQEEEESVIVTKPTVILAKEQGVATLKAARSIPKEYEDKLEHVEIVIRPF